MEDLYGNVTSYSGKDCDGTWVVRPDSLNGDVTPTVIPATGQGSIAGAFIVNRPSDLVN